ncbi:MAG: hypothetical protein ACE5PM_07165 [Candidatus Hydrothermarchaeales archaeon]
MKKDTERKIGLLHALYGFIAGIVVALYNWKGLNLLNAMALGFLISYPMMFICRKLFNLSPEEFQLKDWLGKGFYLFFATWILVWTIVYNLV